VSIVPLAVLGLIVLGLRWMIRKARVTVEDVSDESKGATAGAHLPSMNPDVRDAVVPRSPAEDADTERFRNALPGGGASG
jgi:hypothetical protein